jgi:hypothetical protein
MKTEPRKEKRDEIDRAKKLKEPLMRLRQNFMNEIENLEANFPSREKGDYLRGEWYGHISAFRRAVAKVEIEIVSMDLREKIT